MYRLRPRLHKVTLWVYELMPIVVAFLLTTSTTYGLEMSQRSIAISNNLPGISTQYNVGFTTQANETLGSLEIQFCSNNPIVYLACIAPGGFNDSNAVLSNQSGVSGFSINTSLSNAYTIILSRSPSVVNASAMSFSFSGITNPSSTGEFFARMQTFATYDGTGPATDYGGIAMVIENGYSVSVTVPPYLLFCVGNSIPNQDCSQASGSLINFGNLSPGKTASAESQMVVATNAQYGYAIELNGNTMTSGNNILPPMVNGGTALPGFSQFGINLVGNNNPGIGSNPAGAGTGNITSGYSQPNNFRFNNGDILVNSDTTSTYKEFTVSYILDISKSQSPGVYSTTLSFIGVAYF